MRSCSTQAGLTPITSLAFEIGEIQTFAATVCQMMDMFDGSRTADMANDQTTIV
jgi:hypothetical protein